MRAEGQGRLTGRWRSSRTIVVAGAGIGGLTAALSLAAQGFRVVVLEKAERLEEAGAGLQLSPNASRVLVELGLQPRLAARAVTPDAISIMSARARRRNLPPAARRGRQPFAPARPIGWCIAPTCRARLQAQVNDNPDIELRLGCQFEDVTSARQGADRGPAPRQCAPPGTGGRADRRRRHLVRGPQSSVSGGAAAIFRPDRLARNARRDRRCRANIPLPACSSGWGRTRISSPIRSRARARSTSSPSCREPGTGRAGARPARPTKSRTRSPRTRWPATARMLVGAVDDWRKWALFTVPDGGEWNERRGRAARRRRARHAAVRRARRRHGDRGRRRAGQAV